MKASILILLLGLQTFHQLFKRMNILDFSMCLRSCCCASFSVSLEIVDRNENGSIVGWYFSLVQRYHLDYFPEVYKTCFD